MLCSQSLNAPYGAPYFLTHFDMFRDRLVFMINLNTPYGAPCFLTALQPRSGDGRCDVVLMHLMALRAF